MAKKQTRRSISVSRTTYEKLKSFCETNGISMSQFVENRVGDFLGEAPAENADVTPRVPPPVRPIQSAPRPMPPPGYPSGQASQASQAGPVRPMAAPPAASATQTAAPGAGAPRPVPGPGAGPAPMTSAAARYAVEPPPPIIKRAEQPAPKAPAMPKANEIFTF